MIRNDLDKWLSTNFTNIELKREGLYSTIYKANDIESKAFIAIKIIKARDRENFNLLNQNLTKARVLLHRNIMPIGKIFTGAGFIIAYSMPWGQSLSSRIESGILFLNNKNFIRNALSKLNIKILMSFIPPFQWCFFQVMRTRYPRKSFQVERLTNWCGNYSQGNA